MTGRRAIRAVVTGRVQGVGYRFTTQRVATQMGLQGWVKNQYDGSVEVYAQGTATVVDQFVQFLSAGPPAARVSDVVVSESVTDPSIDDFQVTF